MKKEINWDKIQEMDSRNAFMEGYKKGREDSQDLTDSLKKKLDEISDNLTYG